MCEHEIGGRAGVVWGEPPQSAVIGLVFGSLPGQVVVTRRHHLPAVPVTAVQCQIAESRVLARRRQESAIPPVIRPKMAVTTDGLPARLLHANRVKDALFEEWKDVAPGGTVEDQH